jgi:hypothetical protein
MNADDLRGLGDAHPALQPVSATRRSLSEKLFALEEAGGTALGPALLVSVAIAASKGGGSVIICTDGLANVGLGAMDDPRKKEAADAFFSSVAKFAQERGVVVSVFSIRGTDCKLEYLSTLADLTNGHVDIVDPLNIAGQFSSILMNPIIATNCSLTFILHKNLAFRNEEHAQGNKAVREIGNVTGDTDITFEYSNKPEAKDLSSLPFQVQISYTKLDKAKCIRVITKQQLVTHKREEAEKEVDAGILSANALQHGGQLASAGRYNDSMAYLASNEHLIARAAQAPQQQMVNQAWMKEKSALHAQLKQEQISERKKMGTDWDALASPSPAFAPAPASSPAYYSASDSREKERDNRDRDRSDRDRDRDRERTRARRDGRSDESAKAVFKAKKTPVSWFSSPAPEKK